MTPSSITHGEQAPKANRLSTSATVYVDATTTVRPYNSIAAVGFQGGGGDVALAVADAGCSSEDWRTLLGLLDEARNVVAARAAQAAEAEKAARS